MKLYVELETIKDTLLGMPLEPHYPDFYISIIEKLSNGNINSIVTCLQCIHHRDDGSHYCTKLGRPCPNNADFFCKYGDARK